MERPNHAAAFFVAVIALNASAACSSEGARSPAGEPDVVDHAVSAETVRRYLKSHTP